MKMEKEIAGRELKKDVLDHIEDFIETKIEKNFKKIFDDVEKFVKEDILRSGVKGRKNGEPGPFSYIEALLEDKNVSAIIPSTQFIIDRVLKRVDWKTTRSIIEYGPAEGVITRQLLERLPADGSLVAVETNDRFVAALGRIQDPRLQIIHGNVLDIDQLIAPYYAGPVDTIISGIPFSYLKPVERHRLLHKTDDRLRPGGRFIAYQVTTHLIPLMKYHFEEVNVQYEIRNIPPHFVFTGYKK